MLDGVAATESHSAATRSRRSTHCQRRRNWRSEICPLVSNRLMVAAGTVLNRERASLDSCRARRRSRTAAANEVCTSHAVCRGTRAMRLCTWILYCPNLPHFAGLGQHTVPVRWSPRGPCVAGLSRSAAKTRACWRMRHAPGHVDVVLDESVAPFAASTKQLGCASGRGQFPKLVPPQRLFREGRNRTACKRKTGLSGVGPEHWEARGAIARSTARQEVEVVRTYRRLGSAMARWGDAQAKIDARDRRSWVGTPPASRG